MPSVSIHAVVGILVNATYGNSLSETVAIVLSHGTYGNHTRAEQQSKHAVLSTQSTHIISKFKSVYSLVLALSLAPLLCPPPGEAQNIQCHLF